MRQAMAHGDDGSGARDQATVKRDHDMAQLHVLYPRSLRLPIVWWILANAPGVTCSAGFDRDGSVLLMPLGWHDTVH